MQNYVEIDGSRLPIDTVLLRRGDVLHLKLKEPQPDPLVSILLPTFDYAHRIEAMLSSLEEQTYANLELIVVDDGSSDCTIKTVQPWLGRLVTKFLVHGRNRGAAAAINTAAEHARGDLITWVSADNVMTPNWLAELVESMSDPTVGVVYANYDRFNDQGPQQGTWGKPYDPSRLLADENCFIGPAFAVRAEVWKETGELRGRNSCDYDHWLRIEETCQRRGLRFEYLPEVLCHYYSGNERATVTRSNEYDAHVWQAEAKKRRAS